jgi:aspartyl-tRNA(Asn)/glutamyl-tRNA(Gln) amidotransferase subunit B
MEKKKKIPHIISTTLNTRTKLFSNAPNVSADTSPNTAISPICTGQPGALPIVNGEAIDKAIQFGKAIHGCIATVCSFDRRFRFHPDTPCNFQITQYYNPIVTKGTIGKIPIARAYLEEAPARLIDLGTRCGIDYNPAGNPLLVIVTDSCFDEQKEISLFHEELSSLLKEIGISNGQLTEMPEQDPSAFGHFPDPDLPSFIIHSR